MLILVENTFLQTNNNPVLLGELAMHIANGHTVMGYCRGETEATKITFYHLTLPLVSTSSALPTDQFTLILDSAGANPFGEKFSNSTLYTDQNKFINRNQQLYNEIRTELIESDDLYNLAQFLTEAKIAEIIACKKGLIAYEARLRPEPSWLLFEYLEEHVFDLPQLATLRNHWLMGISGEHYDIPETVTEYAQRYNPISKEVEEETEEYSNTVDQGTLIGWTEDIISFANQPDMTPVQSAYWLAKAINGTALCKVLASEVDRIRWYIMDHLLRGAAAQSSAADSAAYLEKHAKIGGVINTVLRGPHLDHLQRKKEQYQTPSRTNKWRSLAMPPKPDSALDRAYKSAHSRGKTQKIIELLVNIPAGELKNHCHEVKTYKELSTMKPINQAVFAESLIKIVSDDIAFELLEDAKLVPAAQKRCMIRDRLTSSIENNAFARVIGAQISIVHAEIARLGSERARYIDERRDAQSAPYKLCLGEDSSYYTFVDEQIYKLNKIITDKLDLYETGTWAGKSDIEIRNEITVLESLRTALINFEYGSESSLDDGTSKENDEDESFADSLANAVEAVKQQNPTGCKKHGVHAFFTAGRLPSKVAKFIHELVAEAKTVTPLNSDWCMIEDSGTQANAQASQKAG